MALLDANAEQPGIVLARKRGPRRGRGLDGPWLIVVLMVPSLVLMIGIIFYPLFNTVLLSFQSLNLADPFDNQWVGLGNYATAAITRIFDIPQVTGLYGPVEAGGHERLFAFLPHPNAHKVRSFAGCLSEAQVQALQTFLK